MIPNTWSNDFKCGVSSSAFPLTNSLHMSERLHWHIPITVLGVFGAKWQQFVSGPGNAGSISRQKSISGDILAISRFA
jgi:hypothetical protein